MKKDSIISKRNMMILYHSSENPDPVGDKKGKSESIHKRHVFFLFFLCPTDISQGALRFALICPSVRLSICLLPQFLMDLFETLHTYCGHIEDVHVGFWWS